MASDQRNLRHRLDVKWQEFFSGGRLAAQFKAKPLKMLGSIGRDRTPCHRAAGEADHRHIGGGKQKIPGLAIPDEHINDARRKHRNTADDFAHQTARLCVLARQIMTALVPAARAGASEQITSPQCQAISLCPRSLKLSEKSIILGLPRRSRR